MRLFAFLQTKKNTRYLWLRPRLFARLSVHKKCGTRGRICKLLPNLFLYSRGKSSLVDDAMAKVKAQTSPEVVAARREGRFLLRPPLDDVLASNACFLPLLKGQLTTHSDCY